MTGEARLGEGFDCVAAEDVQVVAVVEGVHCGRWIFSTISCGGIKL